MSTFNWEPAQSFPSPVPAMPLAVIAASGRGTVFGICIIKEAGTEDIEVAQRATRNDVGVGVRLLTPGGMDPLPIFRAIPGTVYGRDALTCFIAYTQSPDSRGVNFPADHLQKEERLSLALPSQPASSNFSSAAPASMALRLVPPPMPVVAPMLVAAPPNTSPMVEIAFASCQYPAGFLDRQLAHASYQRLDNYMTDKNNPELEALLLVGDQIYADATAGLLDPTVKDDRFGRPYEALQEIEPLKRIRSRMLVYRMLDDHEINDNWEPYRPGSTGLLYQEGLKAYWKYQRFVGEFTATHGQTWSDNIRGANWVLFFGDSRSLREHRDERNQDQALILGQTQSAALAVWLAAQHATPDLKIVSTASMLLPRTVDHLEYPLYHDNWQGYPASLYGILGLLCEQQINNVVFVSGDAHVGCHAHIKVSRFDGAGLVVRSVNFQSIHCPALYAPLPFANERVANFILNDRFAFYLNGQHYVCRVTAQVLPASTGNAGTGTKDGSCVLSATRQLPSDTWSLTCTVV